MQDLERIIRRKTGKAIEDYKLIDEGDRILVAVSGGKDSWTLLHILDLLSRRAPVNFKIVAVNVNPGFKGYRTDIIESYLRERGFEYHMERSQIYEIVKEKLRVGDLFCSFCSRLRRGILYRLAPRLNCNKIALGHHADDFIETLLLNIFFQGELKAMPPILYAEDGKNIVIRPLVYVWEQDIIRFAIEKKFPIVCCRCPVCGSSDLMRRKIKRMLIDLEKEHPGIKRSILRSLSNIKEGFLMDRRFMKLLLPSLSSLSSHDE